MVHMPLQHQVLEVVREWSILLLAWLCNGLYEPSVTHCWRPSHRAEAALDHYCDAA